MNKEILLFEIQMIFFLWWNTIRSNSKVSAWFIQYNDSL